MKGAAIILGCLALSGCIDRKDDAIDTLRGAIRECDSSTVKYSADLSGPVRKFEVTCEMKS